MNRSDEITLIACAVEKDSIGNQTYKETARVTVFGDIKSVSREENNSAGSSGYSAVVKIVLYPWDYAGQPFAVVNGEQKFIYRTYQSGPDTLEVYAGRRKGVTTWKP